MVCQTGKGTDTEVFRCESTTEEYQKNKFAKEKVISVVQLRRTRTWKVQQKKMVTAEEFDAAVKQVIHDQVSDPKLDGMGKLLIPLTGAIFAKDVKKILFGETEENKEDYRWVGLHLRQICLPMTGYS